MMFPKSQLHAERNDPSLLPALSLSGISQFFFNITGLDDTSE
jgi:hypothetical protein